VACYRVKFTFIYPILSLNLLNCVLSSLYVLYDAYDVYVYLRIAPIKMYGAVDAWIHAFLTLEIRGEWADLPGCC
jgi:hypothetical protein